MAPHTQARARIVELYGKLFMRAVAADDLHMGDHIGQAWCEHHEKYCPIDGGASAFEQTGSAAGCMCYDWSRMGQQRGWFTDSAVVFWCWPREALQFLPTWILGECVPQFDSQMLRVLFKPWLRVDRVRAFSDRFRRPGDEASEVHGVAEEGRVAMESCSGC